MPQGIAKTKLQTKKSKVTKKQLSAKKAGPKQLAPRKKSAIQDAKLTRQQQAALTSATEKLLASRIGHLEMIKGTRRQVEADQKKAAAKGKK